MIKKMGRHCLRVLLGGVFLIVFSLSTLPAQDGRFWQASDTFNKKRFWYLTGGTTLAYASTTYALYEIWYKNYPQRSFHLFNDWNEWENMDKWGHLMTAHAESYLAYKGARWTGIAEKPAIWIGAGIGTLLQSTVEVMDGFSSQWGFSLPDFAFNTAGVALFTSQQLVWGEQRILAKVSNSRPRYSTELILGRNGASTTPKAVAYDVFGSNYFEAFLKDYNGMTIWGSANIHSFIGKGPRWLNLAVGIGANDIYGAKYNGWINEDGIGFSLDAYPRYKQYYLSLDIDTARIPTRSPFLKTIFSAIRWIKIPAPTLEYNSKGAFIFHPVYW